MAVIEVGGWSSKLAAQHTLLSAYLAESLTQLFLRPVRISDEVKVRILFLVEFL
ncbi:hypothetical protein JK386_13190 [Nocardioides sp. zg-536]|uniref:Uncharacterized protein n=1 Tax=Nocardioides faecalis TaxID=2803858 RepID=A0A939BTP1_9ACTN|nr:hypothetical protein [Nocardioides faecalis]MBM9460854.1 hypothetical protein [Nocardioides faecalis]MBS4751829.1 hypothetical protein [Nocardioides faecalis]QVI59313.1 hypothetical protein KG111_02775 [Nocardioides faecalis]